MGKKAAKKRSKKEQQSIFVDSADEDWSTSDEHENGNQDGLAEMSMSVLQDEPRCVADAAPTAAIAIPCETGCVTATPQGCDESAEWANGLATQARRFVAPVSENGAVTGEPYDTPHRPIRQGDHPRDSP